jgi:regulator of ribosome biosynthesis
LAREQAEARHRGKKAGTANATKNDAIPATLKLTTKLDPAAIRGQIAKGAAMKADIQSASYLAGVSTASMGRFDKRLKGEKGGRKLPGQRPKHLPVVGASTEGDIVSKVVKKAVRCDYVFQKDVSTASICI